MLSYVIFIFTPLVFITSLQASCTYRTVISFDLTVWDVVCQQTIWSIQFLVLWLVFTHYMLRVIIVIIIFFLYYKIFQAVAISFTTFCGCEGQVKERLLLYFCFTIRILRKCKKVFQTQEFSVFAVTKYYIYWIRFLTF